MWRPVQFREFMYKAIFLKIQMTTIIFSTTLKEENVDNG
jgi:hypothetical protein